MNNEEYEYLKQLIKSNIKKMDIDQLLDLEDIILYERWDREDELNDKD